MNDRTKLERESGILWNEAEENAVLWTVSEAVKRRMTRILGEPTSTRGPCQEWAFPKSWVKLPRKPRKLSDSARTAAAERLKVVRGAE